MTRTAWLAVVLGLALALIGCTATDSEGPPRTVDSPTAQAATESPVGEWGTDSEDAPRLTIYEDGTVQGNDGCNGFGGKWAVTDGVVQFSEMLQTMMACMGPDLETIGPIVSAVVDGDSIHIFDEQGNPSGTLQRAHSD